MDMLQRVCNVLISLPQQPDSAAQVHAAAMVALQRAGFEVFPEFPVEYDGRGGRIDIAVHQDGKWTGIEIDARKPRKNSVRKLSGFVGNRVIALRGVEGPPPEGIDAVVAIPVRLASYAEQKDKRTTSKFWGRS